MKKEKKTRIITNITLALIGAGLTVIAFKLIYNDQAKRIEETTVTILDPPKIDKVSSTDNAKKIAWMEGIYNSK